MCRSWPPWASFSAAERVLYFWRLPRARFAWLLFLPTVLAAAGPAVERIAPREEASLVLAGQRVAVTYGRPALQGRGMFGLLVPYGAVWRTGADEASKLTTEAELRFGTQVLPRGAYALFTIPGERGWQLVLNRTADQWGAFNYDPALDALRVPMRLAPLSAPIERLSMALTAQGENGGTLWIGWERVVASVDFEAVPGPVAPPAQ